MLKLKTPPAKLPISVAEAKAFLELDAADKDVVVDLIIRSTVSALDGHKGLLGRCMIQQTWEYYPDSFAADPFKIPLGDLISVGSIEYKDPTTGNYVAWSSSNYTVDTLARVIKPNTSWPTPKANVLQPIRITFDAGYGPNPADVPAALREAMMMLVVHSFDNRSAVSHETVPTKVPLGFEFRFENFRRIHL
jgi:uncharacterized phiE125 gp8 family phage protein